MQKTLLIGTLGARKPLKGQPVRISLYFSALGTALAIGVTLWLMRALKVKK
jgi:hypothetical protein